MKLFFKYLFINLLAIALLQNCGDNPKTITAEGAASSSNLEDKTGIFSENPPTVTSGTEVPGVNKDVHTVLVEEVLPTSKYIYLYVTEDEKSFWIATTKQEVEVGKTYFYKGGLLKKNFESKEHNRIFEELFLVSKVVPANHGGSDTAAMIVSDTEESKTNTAPRNVSIEGSMKIADLVANPEKYEGQIVQISGECVKVNPNIMGRNWMHLKDGSNDDFDLVITSDVAVPEGHVVTMKAKVVLNKDFGAGYRYDLILEEGELVR